MSRDLSLAPCGLVIESVEAEAGALVILAHSASRSADCPLCGSPSAKIHSTYQRSLTDLPSHGRAVRIKLLDAPVPLCPGYLRAANFHGAAHGDGRPTVCSADDASGKYRASSWAGPGRPSWAGFRAAPAVTGQQGYVAARRSTSFGAPATAARVVGIDDWAFQAWPSLWHDHLRPGATAHHRPAARPRGGEPLPPGLRRAHRSA